MLNNKKSISMVVLLGILGGLTQSSFCYAKSERKLKDNTSIVAQNKKNFKKTKKLESNKAVSAKNISNFNVTKLKQGVDSLLKFLFSTRERQLYTALAGAAPVLSYLVFRGIKNYNAPVSVKEVVQDNTEKSKEMSKTEAKLGTEDDSSSTSETEVVSENKAVTPEGTDGPNKTSKKEILPKTENTNEENNIPQGTNTNSDVQKKGQPHTSQKIILWLVFNPWRCSPTVSLLSRIFGFYDNFNMLFNVTFCPDETIKVKMNVLQWICFLYLITRFNAGVIRVIILLLNAKNRKNLGLKDVIIGVIKFLEPCIAGAVGAFKGLIKEKGVGGKVAECLKGVIWFDDLFQEKEEQNKLGQKENN